MTLERDQYQLAVQAALELPQHARVLLIGGTDTGKTTLASHLINALSEAGRMPVAVVDGDLGQSEIGAPGTVGLGLFPTPASVDLTFANIRSLNQIPLLAANFVGAVTPQWHVLDTASAIIQTTQSAMLLTPRPCCTIIDTPGYVTGSGASLLRALVDVIRPQLVIALARGAELDAILRPLETEGAFGGTSHEMIRILRQPLAPSTGRKTAVVRATRRAARFAKHLLGARELQLDWAQSSKAGSAPSIVLEKTWISYGWPLPPHEMQFVTQTIGARCLHAERLMSGDLAAVIGGGPIRLKQHPSTGGQLAALEQGLGVKRVLLEPISRYEGLLCGLMSARGDLLGIGLITGIDFLRHSLRVLTPVRAAGAVARVAFGDVRLRPDGREIAQPAGDSRR